MKQDQNGVGDFRWKSLIAGKTLHPMKDGRVGQVLAFMISAAGYPPL